MLVNSEESKINIDFQLLTIIVSKNGFICYFITYFAVSFATILVKVYILNQLPKYDRGRMPM
jgi:cytochrome oxidase assembly protein ShyY1